jgi:ethanolamine kinase
MPHTTMGTKTADKASASNIRFIPLSYNNADSQTSALRLILALMPQWEHTDGKIEFVRFTDGITNTLLKAINKRPGLSVEEVDADAVLLRAYGKGTDVIIDRERETQNHELLMGYGLAPELLARFTNGMLYRFIQGSVTSPADLRRESIYRGVASRLAQWHAVVPCLAAARAPVNEEIIGSEELSLPAPTPSRKDPALQSAIDNVAPGKLAPNVWSVMQKWIYAVPAGTDAERKRQATLQTELTKLVKQFSNRPGLGQNGVRCRISVQYGDANVLQLVFAHCDLLSGNVIVQPRKEGATKPTDVEIVSFIDYEYATPSPAAFDIANHFAEWGGFDCDFTVLPTRSQRLDFIREYIKSYFSHLAKPSDPEKEEEEVQKLFEEVDLFRGVPGFYWGIWAIIQATISQIDFDYAAYAEIRLGEYWAWQAEVDGSRAAAGEAIPIREKRWAQEA